MMPANTYLADVQQLLQAFENTQGTMLQKQYQTAWQEFQVEMNELKHILVPQKKKLENDNGSHSTKSFLLTKQIERLLKFMQEFAVLISPLEAEKSIPEERILFLFERQYRFKVILKRHLDVYRQI
jgi:hypothetical protein